MKTITIKVDYMYFGFVVTEIMTLLSYFFFHYPNNSMQNKCLIHVEIFGNTHERQKVMLKVQIGIRITLLFF